MDCNEWKEQRSWGGNWTGWGGNIVRHRGTYVWVHPCRIPKAKDHQTEKADDAQEPQTESNAEMQICLALCLLM